MTTDQPDSALYEAQLCPFLGLSDDPQTALAFPSNWNYCYKAKPPQSVALAHQRKYCQSVAHRQCPVLQTGTLRPLPPEALGPRSARKARMMRLRRGIAIAALLLCVVVIAWYAFVQTSHAPAFPHQQPDGAQTSSETHIITP